MLDLAGHSLLAWDITQSLDHSKAMLPSSKARSKTPTVPGYFQDATDESDEDGWSEDGMHYGYASLTPLLSAERHLPPTPPSRSPEQVDSAHPKSTSDLSEFTSNSSIPYSMRASTPIHHHQPPTPEITPPNTRERLAVPRPQLFHYASSQAESFVTAQEDQQSAASQSQIRLASEEHDYTPRVALLRTPSPARANVEVVEAGTAAAGETTPTRQQSTRNVRRKELPSESHVQSAEDHLIGGNVTPEAAYDEPMQNVTVRKVRHKPGLRLDKTSAHGSPSARKKEQLPSPKQRGSLYPPSEVEKRSSESFLPRDVVDQGWSHQVNDSLYAHIRDEKSKRLSGISWNSNIVEALVVSNPPQPRRFLRHAGRNLALRDGETSISGSRRTSAESEDSHRHILRHKTRELPGRGLKDTESTGTSWQVRMVSTPEARSTDSVEQLQSHRSMSLNALCGDPEPDRSVQSKNTAAANHQLRIPTALQNEILRPKEQEIAGVTNAEPAQVRHRHAMTGPSLLDGDGAKAEGSVYRIFPKIDAESKSEWARLNEDAVLLPPIIQMPPRRTSEESPVRKPDTKSPVRYSSPIGRAGSGSSAPMYMDQFAHGTSRRRSLEPGMEHASARHLLANNTPLSLSQFSDRTDTLEINEAKAVNIYPHHNESLLCVQQKGSSMRKQSVKAVPEKSGPNEDKHESKTPIRPIFTAFVRSSTPPDFLKHTEHVESPLTNPRTAPQPPAIKFIPPTPNDELDRQLIAPDEADAKGRNQYADGAAPVRRQSLMQKARRYSESFVQPFLGRNSSLSRRRRHSARRPGEEERDAKLHPLWRPRGFWDDFDSDSEDEDFDDDPLPPGGDTSDDEPEARQSKMWRARQMSVRMPGFRGTGGFLLGNSLGLGRHGTNNRRHYIEPPSFIKSRSNENVAAPKNGLGIGLRKRKSEQMLRTMGASADSLRRRGACVGRKRQRSQRFPRLGLQVQYVGIRGFRDRMHQIRGEKEERAAEKRRQELREKIGPRIYHGPEIASARCTPCIEPSL